MAEMRELNEYQQIYLQTIFDFFHKEGNWPTYSRVEKCIERTIPSSYPDFDMYIVSRSLPGGFATNFGHNRQYNQKAEFIVPALYYCQGAEAEEERADFIRVLRFCVAKYTAFINEESSDKDEPEILSEELSSQLHMQPLIVRKMGLLLMWEGDITNGGSASDPDWNNWKYNLKRGADGVRRFRGVETFEQYLEKRTPVQWPDHTRNPVVPNIAAYAALGRNQYHSVQGSQYNILENSEETRNSASIQEKASNAEKARNLDVLLVTVTEVEAKAILRFFPNPELCHMGDQTYHNLGIIKGARIFMVQSEMGPGGPSGATLTIEESIRLLNPSAVIMVGIAFGVSEKKQNIGNILVSKQLIQYDLQRVGMGNNNEQEISLRDDRPSASPRMLQRFRAAANYWQIPPIVEFGSILSGAKLINNQDFRNQLLRFAHEAIGGEMEGSGLYAAAQRKKVDWIVVKAICDWADGNKHQDKEQRQQLAAENAARFTLYVLEQGGFGENSTLNTSKEHGGFGQSQPNP